METPENIGYMVVRSGPISGTELALLLTPPCLVGTVRTITILTSVLLMRN